MDSPRRSPRIASRASLEGIREAESPLAARTLARKHPRASTSAESIASLAVKPTKIARRAHSVGGATLSSGLRKSVSSNRDDLTVPSRRNVPGPRKSAIRALPPQVFLSPSELSPPHSSRPLFSRKSLGLEAFGGSDLMKMMESIGILRSPRNSNVESPAGVKVQANMPRKSAPAAGRTSTFPDDQEFASRNQRRVTFNPYQEKADFVKDEPTMRIRPASDADLIRAELSNSDTSASTTQSASENSDMSLDTNSQDSNDHEDSSSESEAEVEGHLGAADESDLIEKEDTDDTATMEEDDSAMDMTAAYGGMQNATMTGVPSGSNADDTDSDTQSDSSSETSMQLTEVHNDHSLEDGTTRLSSSSFGVGMDSEMEVEEEDDVEKQLQDLDNGFGGENSAMDLTDVLQEQLSPPRPRNSRSTAAARSSISSVRSSRSSKGASVSIVRSASLTQQTPMSEAKSPSFPRETPLPFSPRKAVKSPMKDALPLQSRPVPNARVHRSPSPSFKAEEKDEEDGVSVKAWSSSPVRRPTLHQRESTSPRRGHEHCGRPAAESPKPRVSLATLRSQARRAVSPSPRKSIAASLRTSIGQTVLARSPERLPFRSSVKAGDKVPHHTPSESKQADVITKSLQKTPERVMSASPPRRSSSPLRPPNSPSRAWQSFREEQRSPTMPISPARRISVPGRRATLGSPQRIEVGPRIATPAVIIESTNEKKITMKDFFDSLNMGFLDLSLPHKRRIDFSASTSGSSTAGEKMKASCVDVPALDSLLEACKELKESVDDGRDVLMELERDFHRNPPSYVAEVMAMDTVQERPKAIASFKLQKSAARAIALRAYYGWRTDKQFDDSTLQQLTVMRERVVNDAHMVGQEAAKIKQEAMPALRQRRAALQADVQHAHSRQKEIVEWDPEEMQAMHEAMIEQNSILQEQRTAHDETRGQLERLLTRIEEIGVRKKAAEAAIAAAHASSSAIHGSTRSEASRLARFVFQLETLQQWSVIRVRADELCMEMEADGRGTVTVTMRIDRAGDINEVCINITPGQESVGIAVKLHERLAVHLEADLQGRIGLRTVDVVRRIGTAWSRLRQLFVVVARLQARHPTQIALVEGDEAMEISAHVLLEGMRAKALVRARCTFHTLIDIRAALFAPSSVFVDRIYGHKNASAALLARISDALLHHDTSVRDGFSLADSVDRAVDAMDGRSGMHDCALHV